MIYRYTDYQSKKNPRHWVRTIKTEGGIVHFAVYEGGVWFEHELPESEFLENFEVRK